MMWMKKDSMLINDQQLNIMISDIDENGFNTFQRATVKRWDSSIGRICHKSLGCFKFAREIGELTLISKHKMCRLVNKRFNVVITKRSYLQNNYLKSIGSENEIVGLTWKDLGFYMESTRSAVF
jgi:hypothetical protein